VLVRDIGDVGGGWSLDIGLDPPRADPRARESAALALGELTVGEEHAVLAPQPLATVDRDDRGVDPDLLRGDVERLRGETFGPRWERLAIRSDRLAVAREAALPRETAAI